MSIYIHGMGHFHPENILDNAFFEDLDIETNAKWILERVGIRTRHTVLPLDYIQKTRNQDVRAARDAALYSNVDTAKLAANMALERASIQASQIGLVISGSCAPDTVTPAEACAIAGELGINAKSVDLNSACSTFGAQVNFLAMMQPNLLPDYILLVIPENNTRTIDYKDRKTAILWGDGTFACVISTRVPSKIEIKHSTLETDPKGWKKVIIPRLGHFSQEGSAVQAFAIRRTAQCYRQVADHYLGSDKTRRIYFVGHQANRLMLESVSKRCDVKPGNHLYNVDAFGNTGAAGAPTVISQHWNDFHKSDVVALSVVGAGLTWSSLAIEFH